MSKLDASAVDCHNITCCNPSHLRRRSRSEAEESPGFFTQQKTGLSSSADFYTEAVHCVDTVRTSKISLKVLLQCFDTFSRKDVGYGL